VNAVKAIHGLILSTISE